MMRQPLAILIVTLVVAVLAWNFWPVQAQQDRKFECNGTIEKPGTDLKTEPRISGELVILFNKREVSFTSMMPPDMVYGKIWSMDDLMVRFKSPDGKVFGGVDRTSGDLMFSKTDIDTTYWLKCVERQRLF